MKKNIKNGKTISLGRETLARLSGRQLDSVNGGASVMIRCGLWRTCPGACYSVGDDSCLCTGTPKG